MGTVFAVLMVQGLLVFWAWMFVDMTGNQDMPYCFIAVTGNGNPRLDWNFAVIFLSVVAAVYYYVNVCRQKM